MIVRLVLRHVGGEIRAESCAPVPGVLGSGKKRKKACDVALMRLVDDVAGEGSAAGQRVLNHDGRYSERSPVPSPP